MHETHVSVSKGASGGSGKTLPSGRHKLPREEVERSQRERLLGALAEASAEKGYTTVTISDIVKRARVSKRVLYEHFDSKEECFAAAVDEFGERAASKVVAAQDEAEGEWTAELRAGLAALVSAIAAEPDLAKLAFLDSIAVRAKAHEHYSAGGEQLHALLQRALADAPAGVDAAPGALRSALGGALGLITDHLIADNADQLPEILPELVYVVLVPYLSQREALEQADRSR